VGFVKRSWSLITPDWRKANKKKGPNFMEGLEEKCELS
jgi:hypothetical protein